MDADRLLALQQIDSQLDGVANRRPRLAELHVHKEATAALAALQARIAAADQRAAAAMTAIEQAEHAAAALTTKRERLERQLKTVISPREAEALMHEISTLNAQRGELDDNELTALDEQAAAEQESGELNALLAEVQENVERAASALADAHAALATEEAQHRAEREAAVAALSADDIAVYERARQRFGGVGVAKLDGSRCSGCHLDLSRAEVDAIKALPSDTLAECPQCGRYLVR